MALVLVRIINNLNVVVSISLPPSRNINTKIEPGQTVDFNLPLGQLVNYSANIGRSLIGSFRVFQETVTFNYSQGIVLGSLSPGLGSVAPDPKIAPTEQIVVIPTTPPQTVLNIFVSPMICSNLVLVCKKRRKKCRHKC